MSSPEPFQDTEIKAAPRDILGIFKSLGPGLIISASIVGSGELIVTTKLGADVGFTLLWYIIVGCLLKVLLQIEWGRYVLGSGKSTLQALQYLPGPRLGFSWLNWCWFFMFLATFFQVAGMLGGVGDLMVSLGASGGRGLWVTLTALLCLVLLVIGKYGVIEKSSTLMVAAFTIFTIASVIGLAWTPYAITGADWQEGFAFHLPDELAVAFAAFGVIGVGASELLYYPYWCLEKGYARFVGPRDDSDAWKERAQGWLRVMKYDAWVSMLIYTFSTIAFYLLGAAILHRKGETVANSEMITTLSSLYTEVFGSLGFWAFGVGAFVVLFSTIFISTASNTRLIADAAGIFGWIRLPSQRRTWIVGASVVLPLVYWTLEWAMKQPVSMVLLGALAQAFMLPLLAWALWGLQKEIPSVIRGGNVWMAFLALSTLSCTALGAWQLWEQIQKWLA